VSGQEGEKVGPVRILNTLRKCHQKGAGMERGTKQKNLRLRHADEIKGRAAGKKIEREVTKGPYSKQRPP